MLKGTYANCNKASLSPTYQKCSGFQVNLHMKWSETIVLISPMLSGTKYKASHTSPFYSKPSSSLAKYFPCNLYPNTVNIHKQ
jgi:hypothetical protein